MNIQKPSTFLFLVFPSPGAIAALIAKLLSDPSLNLPQVGSQTLLTLEPCAQGESFN
jgi:hypothetical protein